MYRHSLPLVGGAGVWAALGLTDGLRMPPTRGFVDLLVALAGWVLVVGACWFAAVTVSIWVEAVSRGRLTSSRLLGCPATLRRTLLGLAGAALVAGATVPAYAASHGGGPDLLEGLAVPDRAMRGTVPPPGRATRVTVHVGDSLWSLAQQAHPHADDGQVAGLTARLYARNRRTIGPDPDLIHPGQHLLVPGSHDAEEARP